MQNQIHYANFNNNNGQMGMGSPKFPSMNYIKTFDKTLPPPNNTLKHYSSNPNISLEYSNHKQKSTVEPNGVYSSQVNKNIDFRTQNNNMNNGIGSTQATSPRASRQVMTQSLIINDG